MPRITQYDAPDNLGLRPTETGIAATANAARRVEGNYREAAAAQLDTGRRVNSAIQAAGLAALKMAEHSEISAGAMHFAEMQDALTKQWNQTINDPNLDLNDPAVAEKFRNEVLEPTIEKYEKSFLTEKGQRFSEAQSNSLRQHMMNRTSADMATRAGVAAQVNVTKTLNALSGTAYNDPSSLEFARSTLQTSVDNLTTSSPYLTPAQAAKVRGELALDGEKQIVRAAIEGTIAKGGDWRKLADENAQYVDRAELEGFVRRERFYQQQAKMEDRAARVEAERQARNQFNTDVNKLELSLFDDNGNPVASPQHVRQLREIVESNPDGAALEPGRVRTMMTGIGAMIERANKPEPLARVSHETTVDLLQRIRASDDTRLQDNSEIYRAYEQGKLNNADFNFLQREFKEVRTPEGERLAQSINEIVKAVKPSIDRSNPLMGKIDQDGPLNLYRFQFDLNQKIAEYRRLGRNPYDLLDPSKPDYVGNPKALEQYQKPINESIRDQARRLTGARTSTSAPLQRPAPPTVSPRKPGESLQQYEDRKKGLGQ